MERIKKWIENNIELSISIIVIILFLIPLTWIFKKCSFDIARFTEEWYKTIFTSLGIGIIAIIVADRLKEGRVDKRTQQLIREQRDNVKKILLSLDTNGDAIKAINQFLSTHNKLQSKTIVGMNYLQGMPLCDIIIKEMSYYITNGNNLNLSKNAISHIRTFCNAFATKKSSAFQSSNKFLVS